MVFTNKPGRGNQGQSNGNRPQNEPYMNSSPSRAVTGPIHPQPGPDGYYGQSPYGNQNPYVQNPYYDPRLNDPRYQDPRLNPYMGQSPYPDPHFGQAVPQQNSFGTPAHPQPTHRQTGRSDDLKGLSFWREEDENGYYDNAEDQNEKTSQLKFLIAIAALVIGSGILWLGYRFATQSESQVIPLIPAEQGPYKIRPDNPGGMAFPHQEMLVYGRLSPDQQGSQPVERILPEQEQYYLPQEQFPQTVVDPQMGPSPLPVPQQQSVDVMPQNQHQNVQNVQNVQNYPQQQMMPSPQQQIPHQVPVLPQEAIQPHVQQQNSPQPVMGVQHQTVQVEQKSAPPSPSLPSQASIEAVKKDQGQPEIKKEAKVEKSVETKQEKSKDKKDKKEVVVRHVLDSGHYMQLASLMTEASARNELGRLKNKHKDLSLFIHISETGVKKYYRVVVGPFSDRDVALKKCVHVGNGCKVINISGSNG